MSKKKAQYVGVTHITGWWERTQNVGCTPRYSLDEAIKLAEAAKS